MIVCVLASLLLAADASAAEPVPVIVSTDLTTGLANGSRSGPAATAQLWLGSAYPTRRVTADVGYPSAAAKARFEIATVRLPGG